MEQQCTIETIKLEQILNIGKSMYNRNVIGYSGVVDSIAMTSNSVCEKCSNNNKSSGFFGKNAKPPLPDVKVKKFVLICHYCNMSGHIRPKCYKYKKILRMKKIEPYYKPRTAPKIKIDLDNKLSNRLWIRRFDLFCNAFYISLKVVTIDSCYFDSGCSTHMIGDREYLTDYHTVVESHVSISDGEKKCVLGKVTLNADGLPRLKNVSHVERLKANLMSISKPCDQKLNVKFTKNSCKVLNKSREVV